MRRRLSAVLLAAGLCVSALSMNAYAEETEAETVQQVTEAVTEADAAADAGSESASEEEQVANQLGSMLSQISEWSDDQIDQLMEGNDPSSALIAANWNSVKDELGAFVEVTSAETELGEDKLTIVGHAKYEKVSDNTDVVVTYEMTAESVTLKWDVDYPMGILMQRAALNTVMGLGIVFLTLLFLSWLIGQLHIIPDMIEKAASKNKPAPMVKAPAAPAPAAPAAPAAAAPVEEDLTDDLELVAVITAAIAASGTTSGDGFVVRSIKKANKRNWQRA